MFGSKKCARTTSSGGLMTLHARAPSVGAHYNTSSVLSAQFSSSPSSKAILLAKNPVRDTAVAPGAKKPQETYAYNLEEIRAILSVLPEPATTIFAVAAFTGLRRGEICGMRWEDYRDGEIHVTQSIWEGYVTHPKTFQSRGAVPVIKRLSQMLDAHRLRCGNP